MTPDRHRSSSGIVALAAAGLMTVAEDAPSGLALLLGAGFPLVLIWFAEPLAGFVGRIGFRHINRESPPGLVRALGWIFLAVLAAAAALRAVHALGGSTL